MLPTSHDWSRMNQRGSELNLAGSVAVITGAASGIGAALAERLAARRAHLVLADNAREPLDLIAQRLGATAVVTDVSDADDFDRLANVAGDASVVCLNAGVTSTELGPPWAASPQEWNRVLGINVGGVVNGLRAFVPHLVARSAPSHVLITASLAGLATWPGGGPYAASKHAVIAVAEQAALALAETPVNVSVLCPALVRTAMSDVGENPLDVAEAALVALSAKRFVMLPEEWQGAVRERGARLASGLPPTIPEAKP